MKHVWMTGVIGEYGWADTGWSYRVWPRADGKFGWQAWRAPGYSAGPDNGIEGSEATMAAAKEAAQKAVEGQ